MYTSHFYEDLFFWAFLMALLVTILLTIYIVKLHKIAYHCAKKIDVGYTRKHLILLHEPLKKNKDDDDESKTFLSHSKEPNPRQKRTDTQEHSNEIKNEQTTHAKKISSERIEVPLKTKDDYLQDITSQKEEESSSDFAKKIDFGYTRKELTSLHDPLKHTADEKKKDDDNESKTFLPHPNLRQKRADTQEHSNEIKNEQVKHAEKTSSERIEAPLKIIDDYLQNITSQKEKESSSETEVTSL